MPIFIGILLGLSTLLFIGPVLFYLIKSSLESGVRAGIAVALGIIVGDIICVILAAKGLGVIFEHTVNQRWLALAGGIILLSMGIKYIVKPTANTNTEGKFQSKFLWTYAVNGFLINFLNPFVFAVWIGYYSFNQEVFDSEFEIFLSLLASLLTIFLTDCLKSVFAFKLKRYIQPKHLKVLFQLVGIVMVAFGLRLLLLFFQI
ncbi:LysE family transporter [Crocinitomicaceae bacterium]|nr:LysE family transporter [Crocinitomicaceae bacterium]